MKFSICCNCIKNKNEQLKYINYKYLFREDHDICLRTILISYIPENSLENICKKKILQIYNNIYYLPLPKRIKLNFITLSKSNYELAVNNAIKFNAIKCLNLLHELFHELPEYVNTGHIDKKSLSDCIKYCIFNNVKFVYSDQLFNNLDLFKYVQSYRPLTNDTFNESIRYIINENNNYLRRDLYHISDYIHETIKCEIDISRFYHINKQRLESIIIDKNYNYNTNLLFYLAFNDKNVTMLNLLKLDDQQHIQMQNYILQLIKTSKHFELTLLKLYKYKLTEEMYEIAFNNGNIYILNLLHDNGLHHLQEKYKFKIKYLKCDYKLRNSTLNL